MNFREVTNTLIISLALIFVLHSCDKNEEANGNEGPNYDRLLVSDQENIIELTKNLTYSLFSASNNYLCWYEAYTKKIYYQDLSTGKIFELPVRKGRGPNEVLMVMGLEIIDNTMYIFDQNNRKIIPYDLSKKEFGRELLIGKNNITFITSSSGKLFGKGLTEEAILFEIDVEGERIIPLSGSHNETVASDFIRNLHRFDGSFIANDDFIVTVRKFEPTMVRYNLSEGELTDFSYDETRVETEYPTNAAGFSTMLEVVNMAVYDAAFKPNSNSIFLVAKGYTTEIDTLKKNYLYEYNLDSDSYSKIIESNATSIGRVTANDNHLFIYDDEKFTIEMFELN
jgi:hypothetical protein